MAEASYKKESQAGGVSFSVLPASSPFPTAVFVIFAFINAPFIFAVIYHEAGLAIFAPFIFLFSVAILLLKWQGPKASRYRSSAQFLVAKDAITLNGREMSRSDIHRLVLRNHISQQENAFSYDTVIATTGFSAAAGAAMIGAGQRAAAQHLDKLARVSWRLDVEAQGKAFTLAGGLDDVTAYGLMQDVGKVIGFGG